MAEEILEIVERLQSRLSENQEPRKLLKTLKRLGELPMTVDILVETGVGKSVNSLRKHDIAGEMAKGLVAKWKKLVPQSVDRPSGREGRSHTRTEETRSHKRVREPSPEEPAHVEEEGEEDEDEEEAGYQPDYPSMYPQHYSPQHGHSDVGGYQSEGYESPVEEEPVPSPPRKEVRHSKPYKDPAREHSSYDAREQERRKRHMQATGGGGSSGISSSSEGRKRSAEKEPQSNSTHKASKHSRHSTPHESKKDKKGESEGRSRDRRDGPESSQAGDDEEEEPFETPTMSFESFLNYDAPAPSKKKKKPSRPSHSSHQAPAVPAPSVSSKPSKSNGTKRPETTPVSTPSLPEKRKRVVDVVPTLPDIPLPAIQPNYRPLPSIDVTPLSPQRRKVPVSCEEEDAGFTGRRFNSKMVVYSGSKTAYLPKMMSLYEQCIRVLQNNIDSIDEVGGVPFEILEPVLERCTPAQLYRIETSNPYFVEESDDLWMKHCQRDFKRESPQEYESWRELYLRLHDEREERLRMLTQNISSAHASRPKGRQVKMAYVNSVAKPPRDVRRRQEKFGTKNGSTSASVSAAAPSAVKVRPAVPYNSHSSDAGQSSYSSNSESSRPSATSSGGGHSAREKPQVKKIAPMMAKTIKAFKNRFSRR
ncbi:elongin-A [Chanos chanos]|uniref:Elongin-A n=1 Tax=Chanos chanos TaxID=29144 RepID=A0A6J2WMC0_CHACN|nr:elongin-A [Chanos chanos]